MNRTSPPRSAQRVCSSAEIHDPIADELRRYNDHMRDVRGLAAGTRHNHCRIVAQLLPKKVVGGVITMDKLRAVDVRRFIARQRGGSWETAPRILPLPKWQRPCEVTSATGQSAATWLPG